jgi:hypothetical protein
MCGEKAYVGTGAFARPAKRSEASTTKTLEWQRPNEKGFSP